MLYILEQAHVLQDPGGEVLSPSLPSWPITSMALARAAAESALRSLSGSLDRPRRRGRRRSGFMELKHSERRQLKTAGSVVAEKVVKLGRCCMNPDKFRNTNAYVDPAKFERAVGKSSVTNFELQINDSEGFLAFVETLKTDRSKACMSVPTQVGARTLQLSKLMMEKAYYLHMRRLFPKMRLLFTDTDSVMVQIFELRGPAPRHGRGEPAMKGLQAKRQALCSLQTLAPHLLGVGLPVQAREARLAQPAQPSPRCLRAGRPPRRGRWACRVHGVEVQVRDPADGLQLGVVGLSEGLEDAAQPAMTEARTSL